MSRGVSTALQVTLVGSPCKNSAKHHRHEEHHHLGHNDHHDHDDDHHPHDHHDHHHHPQQLQIMASESWWSQLLSIEGLLFAAADLLATTIWKQAAEP